MTFTKKTTSLLLAGMMMVTTACAGENTTSSTSNTSEGTDEVTDVADTTEESTEEATAEILEENGYIDGLSFQEIYTALSECYPDLITHYHLGSSYSKPGVTVSVPGDAFGGLFQIDFVLHGEDQISEMSWSSFAKDEDSLNFLIDLLGLHDKQMAGHRDKDTGELYNIAPFDEWFELAKTEEKQGHPGYTGDLRMHVSFIQEDQLDNPDCAHAASFYCVDEKEDEPVSPSILLAYLTQRYENNAEFINPTFAVENKTLTIRFTPAYEGASYSDFAKRLYDSAQESNIDITSVIIQQVSEDGSTVLQEESYVAE